MRRLPFKSIALSSSIFLGIVAALTIARLSPQDGEMSAYPIPRPVDLEGLVERADVIVSANLSATNGSFLFTGYNSNGTAISPSSPTPDPGGGTPMPYFSLAAYDYPINVTTTYLDDGVVASGTPFSYRSVGAPLEMANSDVATDELLYFIGPNPDGTYATFSANCEILDLSGTDVVCAESGDVWDGANGMSPAQFIPALQTEIASQYPTPTPTP